MAQDTRANILDTAEALFSERGFYGVSLAAIADRMRLTKQALLHHFGSKEKLYGEVLERISHRFRTIEDEIDTPGVAPDEVFCAYMMRLYQLSQERPDQTRLLVRELLDNRRRANTAGTWYLTAFLQGLIDRLKVLPDWQYASEADCLALVYQLLGALNYYAISQPTLTGIFGSPAYAALDTVFPGRFERLVAGALTAGP